LTPLLPSRDDIQQQYVNELIIFRDTNEALGTYYVMHSCCWLWYLDYAVSDDREHREQSTTGDNMPLNEERLHTVLIFCCVLDLPRLKAAGGAHENYGKSILFDAHSDVS
jgi:hypothetical protein